MDPTPLTDVSLADRIWMVVAGIPLGMCVGGVLAVRLYRLADLARRRRALAQLAPGDVPLSLAATDDVVEELRSRSDDLVMAYRLKGRKSRNAWTHVRDGDGAWIAGVCYALARNTASVSLEVDPDRRVDPDARRSDDLNKDRPNA